MRAYRLVKAYWIKRQMIKALWKALDCAREAKHEDSKGGANEVSRLREKLVIERTFLS